MEKLITHHIHLYKIEIQAAQNGNMRKDNGLNQKPNFIAKYY